MEIATAIATDQLVETLEDIKPGIDVMDVIDSFRRNHYRGWLVATQYLINHNPGKLHEYSDEMLQRLDIAKKERLQDFVDEYMKITNRTN